MCVCAVFFFFCSLSALCVTIRRTSQSSLLSGFVSARAMRSSFCVSPPHGCLAEDAGCPTGGRTSCRAHGLVCDARRQPRRRQDSKGPWECRRIPVCVMHHYARDSCTTLVQRHLARRRDALPRTATRLRARCVPGDCHRLVLRT